MRLTSKGQVTIPQDIRELAGMPPGCEVEFHLKDGEVLITKVEADLSQRRQKIMSILDGVAGSVGQSLSTDDVLRMTRGED